MKLTPKQDAFSTLYKECMDKCGERSPFMPVQRFALCAGILFLRLSNDEFEVSVAVEERVIVVDVRSTWPSSGPRVLRLCFSGGATPSDLVNVEQFVARRGSDVFARVAGVICEHSGVIEFGPQDLRTVGFRCTWPMGARQRFKKPEGRTLALDVPSAGTLAPFREASGRSVSLGRFAVMAWGIDGND